VQKQIRPENWIRIIPTHLAEEDGYVTCPVKETQYFPTRDVIEKAPKELDTGYEVSLKEIIYLAERTNWASRLRIWTFHQLGSLCKGGYGS